MAVAQVNADSVLASGWHPQGQSSRCELSLSDSRVLPDVLVLERPSRVLAKRLELSRMYEVLVARPPVCF